MQMASEIGSRNLKRNQSLLEFSCMTGTQVKFAIELAKIVRKTNVPIVWGGVHQRYFTKRYLESGYWGIMFARAKWMRLSLRTARQIEHGEAPQIMIVRYPMWRNFYRYPMNY